MALPDVAVRETITRQSADLGQQQRDVLNNTPVGRLTPPEVTPQGVEVFAVCQQDAGGRRRHRRASARLRETHVSGALSGAVEEVPEGTARQALIEIRQ